MKNIDFMEFIRSERGMQVWNFFEYLINNQKEWDVIIFLTRKGYWLYRMACWYLGIKFPEGKVVVSDRKIDKGDIQEIRNQAGKEDAVVYIVDDTLSTGVTAYRIYDLITKEWKKADVFPVACFLAVSVGEMKKMLLAGSNEEADASYEQFIENLGYFYKASPEELGRFSYEQAMIAQRELVPYVVDLPFMVDETYNPNEEITCFERKFDKDGNRRYSVLTNQDFTRLCRGNQDWKYVDNTYTFADNTIIHTGFFRYYGEELNSILQDAALNMVIKCRYEDLENKQKALVFTPFVMLKSASYSDIWDAFETIFRYSPKYMWRNIECQKFEESSYYKYIVSRRREKGEENIGLNIFRGVIYFFSYYLGRVFAQWLEDDFGILLKYDESFMHENSGQEFVGFISDLQNVAVHDYLSCFDKIEPWTAEHCSISVNNDRKLEKSGESFEELVYTVVYMEVIARKRKNHRDGCFTIEEMERILKEQFIFETEENLRVILTKVLLRMLDTSVIGNRVWYQGRTIYRGFRYGENSDIMLPFFNSYLFFGVDSFYRRLGWDDKQNIKNVFFENVHRLFDEMGDMLRKNGYMGYIVTENCFRNNEIYFRDSREILSNIIENKRFLMAGENTEEIIYRDIDRVVQKLCLEMNIGK